MPQHGDGERGVQRLMAAGQAGQRQIEGALLVAIAELPGPRDRIPNATARQPGSMLLTRDFAYARRRGRRVELGNQRDASLGDARFLARNVGEPVAEELLVIEGEVGDARNKRVSR